MTGTGVGFKVGDTGGAGDRNNLGTGCGTKLGTGIGRTLGGGIGVV